MLFLCVDWVAIMLCQVMLCQVMLCQVMLCHVMLCHVMPACEYVLAA